MNFIDFILNLERYGLAHVAKRFYGLYRGWCADNRDPEKRGRIYVQVPHVGQNKPLEKWVLPATAGAGPGRGLFFPPEIGDAVWVSFREGDPSFPEVYFGGWFGAPNDVTEVPKGLGYAPPTNPADKKAVTYPEQRGIVTRAGHSLLFDDTKDSESVVLKWHKPAATDLTGKNRTSSPGDVQIQLKSGVPTADSATGDTTELKFDKDGGFSVTTPEGHAFTLDNKNDTVSLVASTGKGKKPSSIKFAKSGDITVAHKGGATITLSGDTITLSVDAPNTDVKVIAENVILTAKTVVVGDQAQYHAVLGEKLVQWLGQHTHGTGVGPSSPPVVPPMTTDFCSEDVILR